MSAGWKVSPRLETEGTTMVLWYLEVPEATSDHAHNRTLACRKEGFGVHIIHGPAPSSHRPGPSFPSTIWRSHTSNVLPQNEFASFSHLTRSLGESGGFPDHHSLISVGCFNNTAHRLYTRYSIHTLIFLGLQSLQSGTGNWIRPGTRTCPGSTEVRIFRYFHRGIGAISEGFLLTQWSPFQAAI